MEEKYLVAGLSSTFLTLCGCEAEWPLYCVVVAAAVSMFCLGRFMDYRSLDEFEVEDEEWYDKNYDLDGRYIPRHLGKKYPGKHEHK